MNVSLSGAHFVPRSTGGLETSQSTQDAPKSSFSSWYFAQAPIHRMLLGASSQLVSRYDRFPFHASWFGREQSRHSGRTSRVNIESVALTRQSHVQVFTPVCSDSKLGRRGADRLAFRLDLILLLLSNVADILQEPLEIVDVHAVYHGSASFEFLQIVVISLVPVLLNLRIDTLQSVEEHVDQWVDHLQRNHLAKFFLAQHLLK